MEAQVLSVKYEGKGGEGGQPKKKTTKHNHKTPGDKMLAVQ